MMQILLRQVRRRADKQAVWFKFMGVSAPVATMKTLFLVGVLSLASAVVQGQLLTSWEFNAGDVSGANVAATAGTAGFGDARYTGALQADATVSGGSLQLDGSGDYLQFGNNLTEIRNLSHYTVSAWVNTNVASHSPFARIVEHEDNTYFWVDGTGYRFAGHGDPQANATTASSAGTWQHVVATYSTAGSGPTSIFVNGTPTEATVLGTDSPTNNTQTFQVGARRSSSGAATNFLNAQLDDVAFYNGVLSQSEINALAGGGVYASRTTPTALVAAPVGPALLLHLTMDDANISGSTVADSSGNARNGTMMNGLTQSSDPGQVQQSLDFAGGANNSNSEYIDLSTHVGDFAGLSQGTISAWIRSDGANPGVILAASDKDDGSSEARLMVLDSGGSNVLQFDGRNDGANFGTLTGTTDLADGLFHHVAVTVDSFGDGVLYVDGMVEDSDSDIGFFNSVLGLDTLGVGRNQDSTAGGGQWFFDGLIDDLAIFDAALTMEDIATIYDGGLQGRNVQQALNPVPEPTSVALWLILGCLVSLFAWRYRGDIRVSGC